MEERASGRAVGRRIIVVGSTGAGKTTLARTLARSLGLPHVEMDALFWGPNWSPAEPDDFRRKVCCALAGEAWIVDGNYSAVRDLVWTRADTLIWLDYSLPRILARLFRRQGVRLLRGYELWNGNRDSWRENLGKESLFVWAVQTYAERRRSYPEAFTQPAFAHLLVKRQRTPRETRRWLRRVLAQLP